MEKEDDKIENDKGGRKTNKQLKKMELAEIDAMARKSSRKIKYVVVHCSATAPHADEIDAQIIDSWHRAKGWNGIGYHFVITRSGDPQLGRSLNRVGAHVRNMNSNSIGVCLVGGVDEYNIPECNFEEEQYVTLFELLTKLAEIYPKAIIMGHRDYWIQQGKPPQKACPSFDAKKWWRESKEMDVALFPEEQVD